MRTVTCAVCGRKFQTDRPRAKYCSAECKVKGAAENREVWIESHKDYNRRYYEKHRHNLGRNTPEIEQMKDLPPEQ